MHRTRTHELDPGGAVAAQSTRQVGKRLAAAPERSRLVAAAAPVTPATTTDELRLPSGVLAFLAAGFALLLVTTAVAIVPVRALPRRIAAEIDGRRELLFFVALCTLAVGFVLTLLVAIASS